MQQTLRALVERLPGTGPDGSIPENGAAALGAAPAGASPQRDDMIGTSNSGMPDQEERDEVPLSASSSYVVTPTGSVYHHPACPIIAHHSEGLRVLGPGAVVDLEPCRICLPTLA